MPDIMIIVLFIVSILLFFFKDYWTSFQQEVELVPTSPYSIISLITQIFY